MLERKAHHLMVLKPRALGVSLWPKAGRCSSSTLSLRAVLVRLCPLFWSEPCKAQSRTFLARCRGSAAVPDASRRGCTLLSSSTHTGQPNRLLGNPVESRINNMVTSCFCPLNSCRTRAVHLHELFQAVFVSRW